MSRILTMSLLLCALTVPLSAQCNSVVSAPTSDPTMPTSCNVIPYGQSATWSAGYTYLSRIPASFMDVGNPYVNDISFAPCGTGNWSCNTVVIAMGHVPSPPPAAFNFPTVDASGTIQTIGSFLDLTIVHNSFGTGTTGPVSTTGPFSWNLTQDTWSPMGFAASSGTGFLWNGVDDVAFFITFQNSVVTGFNGGFHRDTLQRTYGAGYNIAAAVTNNASLGLNVQFEVTQGPGQGSIPTWQCNQASSSLTVNGAADPGPLGPIRTELSVGSTAMVDFGGLAGMPYDVALTSPELGLPVGGGGITTPGNQAININLAAPSLQFLLNATLSTPFVASSIPVSTSFPFTLTAQQVVVDPGQIDGFALSHLNELAWLPCSANQDFDALAQGPLTGANVPVAWVSPSNGGSAWTVDTGGTPSTATGPTTAFSGANYLYCETSGNTNTTFSFDTCAVDATQLSQFTLDFALSRIGVTIGTLNIYIDDGTGTFSTLLTSYTGADPLQGQGATEWSNESIFFNPTTALVAFRFEYISGSSFTGDLAIDSVLLQ